MSHKKRDIFILKKLRMEGYYLTPLQPNAFALALVVG